jgi:hypothetical protein
VTTKQKTFGTAQEKRVGPNPGIRFIAPRDLPDLGINYHHNHLRRLWEAGKFPKPVQLSPRKIAWREADLMAWMASRQVA